MRFVWWSLGVGMGVSGWSGCVFGGLGGWVSEFATSGIVCLLILAALVLLVSILTISMSTVCLTQCG